MGEPLPGLRFVYDGREIEAATSGRTRLAVGPPPSRRVSTLEVRAEVPAETLARWARVIRIEPRPHP